MSSVSETLATIRLAIPSVCGPQLSQINRAKKYVNENGENLSIILTGLNNICGGIFMQKAGLGVDVPESQVEVIDTALVAAGKTPPSDMALKKKVGSATLTTTAKDLSGAVNEHDLEIGVLSTLYTTNKDSLVKAVNEVVTGGGNDADVYIPVGTLSSFYSCSSLTGGTTTLIATGKDTVVEMDREKQKCAHWAFSKLIKTTNKSPNNEAHPDYGDPSVPWDSTQPVYASFSSSADECFSISRPGASPASWNSAVAADAYLLCMYGLDHL